MDKFRLERNGIFCCNRTIIYTKHLRRRLLPREKFTVGYTHVRRIGASRPNPFVNSVPPHVCTQRGRVNAQQGRCPLNLKGFLNASARVNRPIGTRSGHEWSLHYSARYRRARKRHTEVDSWRRSSRSLALSPPPPSLVSCFTHRAKSRGDSRAGTILSLFLYRAWTSRAERRRGFPGELRGSFFVSDLTRDQIAGYSPRSRRFHELRI